MLSFLAACKPQEDKKPHRDDITEFNAIIETPAGDLLPLYDNLKMPTFFNVGNIEIDKSSKVSSIILGSRKGKGKRVEVNNLALFSFERDSLPVNFILSYQNDFSSQELDFETFMVKNAEIRESIDSWFKAQCGLGHCRNFRWSNDYKSYIHLYDKKMKN